MGPCAVSAPGWAGFACRTILSGDRCSPLRSFSNPSPPRRPGIHIPGAAPPSAASCRCLMSSGQGIGDGMGDVLAPARRQRQVLEILPSSFLSPSQGSSACGNATNGAKFRAAGQRKLPAHRGQRSGPLGAETLLPAAIWRASIVFSIVGRSRRKARSRFSASSGRWASGAVARLRQPPVLRAHLQIQLCYGILHTANSATVHTRVIHSTLATVFSVCILAPRPSNRANRYTSTLKHCLSFDLTPIMSYIYPLSYILVSICSFTSLSLLVFFFVCSN